MAREQTIRHMRKEHMRHEIDLDEAYKTQPADLTAPQFDENALRVLNERYFATKPDGTVETPTEFLWRVSYAIAKPDGRAAVASLPPIPDGASEADAEVQAETRAESESDVEFGARIASAREFYELMCARDFLPNTPCLVNAGRPLSMLSACFVLGVPDSMDGIFDAIKSQALIQKAGGGCVSADSRVWSTFCGLEPIEVLFNRATMDGRTGNPDGNGVAYDVSDLDIRTIAMDSETGKTGLKKISHVWSFDVPAADQVVVRTREGAVVQTSSWHPFMVLRGSSLEEVAASDLRVSDVILGPDRPDEFWPWNEYRIVDGTLFEEDLAWLTGFTLGDGSFGYQPNLRLNRMRWFSGSNDVLENVQRIIANRGLRGKIQSDPRGKGRYIASLSQPLYRLLLECCGFVDGGPKDTRIRIPEHIAKSPLTVIQSFVAGLMDSDGCVDRDGSPSYTTVSENMARDLAALMSILGYRPSLSVKKPGKRGKLPVFTVLMCGLPHVNRFSKDFAPHMASALRRNRLSSTATAQTALALPFRIWRDVLSSHELAGRNGLKTSLVADELSRWSSNHAGRVRRSDLTAIGAVLATADKRLGNFLECVAERGQEIESVTIATNPMPYYDLTVEDWNTYASGREGLAIIHNTGMAFSRLRGHGAPVRSTGKASSGPLAFMKVFDSATDSIKQSGIRRGANMGVLSVDHPDIFEFMACKKELDSENRAFLNRLSDSGEYTPAQLARTKQELLQTQFSNFNISVGISNAFMDAVKGDTDFDLRDPQSGTTVRTVKAREIWEAIIEGAWQNGEPGVLFLEHPQANPLPGLGPIEASNPCFTADTLILTTAGPQRIADLVGVPFTAIVDGLEYRSTESGAWSTGVKPVMNVRLEDGRSLRVTPNHRIMRATASGSRTEWTEVRDLDPGDYIALHSHAKVLAGFAGAAQGVARVATISDEKEEEVFDCSIPGPNVVDAGDGFYAHNCGEQLLHGGDACNLGSINVGNYVIDGKIDWDRLDATTHTAIRFLDNVVDESIFTQQHIADMVRGNRRVGLGIMGFADMLAKLKIDYGTAEAIAIAETLMERIQRAAMSASEHLAIERGEFPNKHLSVYAQDDRPRRNAALLSIAPTGTISMIAGCSFGCEPWFAIAYVKKVMKDSEGRPQSLYYKTPAFEEAYRAAYGTSVPDDVYAKIAENGGSIRGLNIDGVGAGFAVTADVSVDGHIDMLAAFQRHTCNSVSKTVNAPNNDTRENVARAIMRAFDSGCKGFTYYRDGSRTEQVVNIGNGAAPKTDGSAAQSAAAPTDIDALLAKAQAVLAK